MPCMVHLLWISVATQQLRTRIHLICCFTGTLQFGITRGAADAELWFERCATDSLLLLRRFPCTEHEVRVKPLVFAFLSHNLLKINHWLSP
jgi:hypothetical protein